MRAYVMCVRSSLWWGLCWQVEDGCEQWRNHQHALPRSRRCLTCACMLWDGSAQWKCEAVDRQKSISFHVPYGTKVMVQFLGSNKTAFTGFGSSLALWVTEFNTWGKFTRWRLKLCSSVKPMLWTYVEAGFQKARQAYHHIKRVVCVPALCADQDMCQGEVLECDVVWHDVLSSITKGQLTARVGFCMRLRKHKDVFQPLQAVPFYGLRYVGLRTGAVTRWGFPRKGGLARVWGCLQAGRVVSHHFSASCCARESFTCTHNVCTWTRRFLVASCVAYIPFTLS